MEGRLRYLLLSSLLLLSLLVIPETHASTGYFTYSKTVDIQPGGYVPSTVYGSSLANASWLNPPYVAVVNTNWLQVLPNSEYIENNATFTVNSNQVFINVTFYLNVSSDGSGAYGSIAVGYGTSFPASFTGNYGPSPPYYPDGIVVYLEHGAFTTYHMFIYYNGTLIGNVSVGSLATHTYVSIAIDLPDGLVYFRSSNSNLTTAYALPNAHLNTINNDYVIAVQNVGPEYGYGQWILVKYQYYTYKPPYTVTFSYTAVNMSNGVKALLGYINALNPLNITTNTTSWGIVGIVGVKNVSVTGSVYSLSGTVNYIASSPGMYFTLDMCPTWGSLSSWYLNVTVEFEFVTPSATVYANVTIPIVPYFWAVSLAPNGLPSGTYTSGQSINITYVTQYNFPKNLGYSLANQPVVEIDIQGLTNGYVKLPYSTVLNVSVTTTYTYTFTWQGGVWMGPVTGSFTVFPLNKYPVIFVSPVPQPVTAGTKLNITFQFSYNTPAANVTSSAFIYKTSTFMWAYADIVSQNSLIEFDGYWASANDGLLIITRSTNYLIPFNGSLLPFHNNTVNEVQIQVLNKQLWVTAGGVTTIIGNSTPVIGIGFYYYPGALDLKWLYVNGIVLPSATADQSYVVLTGTNPSTLSPVAEGYTNATGYGKVTVTLTDTPYELIDIDWYGVKYVLLNITVVNSTTSATSSTVNVSTLNYNYTKPFNNNIAPNSTLYNFSSYGPWPFVIGLVIVVVVALLGWKFGASAGALGGAVMGLITTGYLGLLPWWLYYVFVLGIALLLARIFVNRFMGGEQE